MVAISTPAQRRDRRLHLRATAAEVKLINAAADRQDVNVTEFIMRSARERGEQALARPVRKSILFSGYIIRLIRSHSALTVRKPPAQATSRRYPGWLKANWMIAPQIANPAASGKMRLAR